MEGRAHGGRRPKVSDAILARLKNISMEEAWGVLANKGYMNQFEMIGRSSCRQRP